MFAAAIVATADPTMNDAPVGVEVCANCGKVSSDDAKLKNCTACRLVKGPSQAAQEESYLASILYVGT